MVQGLSIALEARRFHDSTFRFIAAHGDPGASDAPQEACTSGFLALLSPNGVTVACLAWRLLLSFNANGLHFANEPDKRSWSAVPPSSAAPWSDRELPESVVKTFAPFPADQLRFVAKV